MVALGSSYGIHFMNRYYRSRASGGSGREAVRRAGGLVGRPLVMAGVTTAVGMATLVIFKIRMIQQFGIFMAVGILLVVLVTLTLVPALLSLREVKGPAPRRGSAPLPRLLGWLAATCRNRARVVLLFTGAATAAGAALALSTRVGIDLPSYFPKDHEQRVANDMISARLGGAAEATLLVSVNEELFRHGTRDPAFLARLLRFEERVRGISGVGHVQSLADVVRHVHRRVQQGIAEEEGNKASTPPAPRNKAHVDQLLLLYAMGAGMQAIDRLEDPTHTHAAVKVAIRTWDQAEHRRILREIREHFTRTLGSGATLATGGDVVLMLAFDHYIVWGKLLNIALTLVVVFLCCAVVYRSARHGLLSLIPVAFSTLVTFSLMGALGIRLTMATAVITSIAIGVGVDFAIHFLDHFRDRRSRGATVDSALEQTISGVGPAVVYDAGSNILGFLPLVLSSLVPVQHFGWLISSCMLFSALATLIILPAVLKVHAEARAPKDARSPEALLGLGHSRSTTEGTR
jgi:predicted RND superfamily exporter protein